MAITLSRIFLYYYVNGWLIFAVQHYEIKWNGGKGHHRAVEAL